MKKSASKGDKKKKKEVTEEIARLEAEIIKKQEDEITEFKAKVIISLIVTLKELKMSPLTSNDFSLVSRTLWIRNQKTVITYHSIWKT